MTAAVEIFVADIPNALTVNVSAVVEQGGKFFVWVAKPDKPERRPVLLGRTDENVVEIKDGVVEGENVLLNPRAVVAEAREDDAVDESTKDLPQGIPTGPDAGTGQGKPAKPAGPPKFSDLDKNKDGKLTEDEAPERMKQNFSRLDTDKDGSVSPSEWAAIQRRRQQGGGPGGPGGGGPGGRPGGPGGRPGGAGAAGAQQRRWSSRRSRCRSSRCRSSRRRSSRAERAPADSEWSSESSRVSNRMSITPLLARRSTPGWSPLAQSPPRPISRSPNLVSPQGDFACCSVFFER